MSTHSLGRDEPAGSLVGNRPGFGMLAVILVMLLAGAVAAAAGMLGVNTVLIGSLATRESLLAAAADDGLESARAQLNGDKTLYSDTMFRALETDAAVTDNQGRVIPGLKRTTWVGPAGIATGQYGIFGSVVVEAMDGAGNRVIRREAVNQESFAKYAWFTNSEGGNIFFANGDQIQGPVFSNDFLRIDASGATFWGPVSTAMSIIGRGYGTYKQGYKEAVSRIPMPTGADLAKLRGYATAGQTVFTPQNDPPGDGDAHLRVDFLWVDVNSNGIADADEAYIRVYESQDPDWVTGHAKVSKPEDSPNCGHVHTGGKWATHFVTAKSHGDSWQNRDPQNNNGNNPDKAATAMSNGRFRCYFGGDPAITDGQFQPATANTGPNQLPNGSWRKYTNTPDADLVAKLTASGLGNMAPYLFPISHARNPEFKGVIFVDGKVAVSGTVRGHVTLAATHDIIIVDDIKYAIDRGAGGCQDLLGLYAAGDILMADNMPNAPVVVGKNASQWAAGDTWTSLGSSNAEFLDAVVMALGSFRGENYSSGSLNAQPCEGRNFGRGCLYLTGGIIQGVRGAVGQTNGTGYSKRYSYDACAAIIPPPYFPTTGHFEKGQYFEVDPKGFDMATYTSHLMARH